ncbi:type 1 fimbrial protein [Scandinavium sp. V105_16]|uniref:Type 1 fimbrial protein n=1 Tax=Scandinavium lactucae TaxID=3095028 RepID=A0AAJ2VU44_9ENTR|nr:MULTISPECIES: type 1 fimbrial protein [unclassified Scandinavium]MDX6022683.1 type 1 fimbrial protein [Scandinavium sp. V105_16]MDX6033475.1 type 1 fimbrial protein [Scandinavium sp. V105_12]MDX6042729.1 type 1 fimbrial protein [Scandinavium sp. V105_6]MDX6052730.1 type 1 fimbrial protein [Scandinavium sp. V105_1]
MKTLTTKFCFALCLSSALLTGAATAASTQVNGGVIHFVGSIVEDPCNIATRSEQISLSCYRKGKMQTSTISYQQATVGKLMNNEMATVSMRYINPQKTLGVVTVAYR